MRVPNGESGEWIPWTSASGPPPDGLRPILIRQYQMTLDKALPIVEADGVRNQLFKQLIELCDLVLDGYQVQLNSIPAGSDRQQAVLKQYEKDRSLMITPLSKNDSESNTNDFYHLFLFPVQYKQCWDEVIGLSEKYLEFNALVKICELSGDNERLEGYMEQFGDQNFANFVFDWHLRQGKQSKLLKQQHNNRRQDQLGAFLEGHAQISWLHNIQTSNYAESAQTLKKLADAETDVVGRKKTMLSLAKLSALVVDQDQDAVDVINKELNVINAQENLPASVVDSLHFKDPSKMKVLTPRDLIELYIGEDNHEADHLDFKKALDLVAYVAPTSGSLAEFEEEVEQLKLRIWALAVGRNDWSEMNSADPLEAIKETVFFQLVDFCYVQGIDLNAEMPSCEQLLEHPTLKDANSNAKYLIKTGYEHIQGQLDVPMSSWM